MAAPLSEERVRERFSGGFNMLKALWPSGIQDNHSPWSRRPLLERGEVRNSAARVTQRSSRDLDRIAFETKPYPEGNLKLRLPLGIHRSADVLDLEPVEVAQRLTGLFERVAHGLMDALVGDADHVDYLISFVRHGTFSWRLHASLTDGKDPCSQTPTAKLLLAKLPQ